jgi:hypothetical protein
MFSYGKLRINTKNWNSDATVFTRKEKYEKLENNNLNILGINLKSMIEYRRVSA